VTVEKPGESLVLFPGEKDAPPPSKESVLGYLAQSLSVAKTLKRFPSLQPKDLQEILLSCARQFPDPGRPGKEIPAPLKRGGPEVFIHTDGAARGNPGEAGAGVVITDACGRTVKELKQFLGTATNNVAEYRAAILGLEKAFELGATGVTLQLDSELVGKQLRGEYKVREEHLKPLHRQALDLLNRFSRYNIICIGREENRRADQLANEAIEQKTQ
jgi:ribonuclease HI